MEFRWHHSHDLQDTVCAALGPGLIADLESALPSLPESRIHRASCYRVSGALLAKENHLPGITKRNLLGFTAAAALAAAPSV